MWYVYLSHGSKKITSFPLIFGVFFCFQKSEISYLETSAITGENVQAVFTKLTKSIIQKLESGEIEIENVAKGTVKRDVNIANNQASKSSCLC